MRFKNRSRRIRGSDRIRGGGWRSRGFHTRRRSIRAIIAALAAILGIAGYAIDRGVRHSPAADADWQAYDKHSAKVTRVVDGDTLVIDLPDKPDATTKIRLLGIDAPELHDDATGKADYFADRALAYAKARAEGQTVTIRLDETRTRDKYGRLLAYVYLSNAEMLNEALVRDGQAYAFRTFPCQFLNQLETAEGTARSGKRGLWKEVQIDQMPEWRREWLKERGLTTP
ncbi:MAG: thermonuclease family protein [Tepidisphaeraceae bacterium]